MTSKTKKITPKDLGLVDGVKLSESYRNTRENYKVIEDSILGYYVAAGMNSPTRIAPIYRATIYQVTKESIHCIVTHEIGAYFNPPPCVHDEAIDYDGDALARLAATTLGYLEKHAMAEAYRKQRKVRK